jgi:hypothetical protein
MHSSRRHGASSRPPNSRAGRTPEEEHRVVDIHARLKSLRDYNGEMDGFLYGHGEIEEITQTSISGDGHLGDFVFSEGYKKDQVLLGPGTELVQRCGADLDEGHSPKGHNRWHAGARPVPAGDRLEASPAGGARRLLRSGADDRVALAITKEKGEDAQWN